MRQLFLTFLIASITLAGKCDKTKNEEKNENLSTNKEIQTDVPTILYDANSRGYHLDLRIENKQLFSKRERDGKSTPYPISDADWKEIAALLKTVDVAKVGELKWPTEKRHYDGAAHANIHFIVGDKTYGHPPVEIEKLVTKILDLEKKATKNEY
jgi:hypothetical protein